MRPISLHDDGAQDLASFRREARAWLAANGTRREERPQEADVDDSSVVEDARRVQRQLFEAGLAGIAVPAEYGGRGLGAEHRRVFDEEAAPYDLPDVFDVTLGIIAPTFIDFATEEQKRRHVPAMLRGEELWVQLLSEPTGGSDMAGAITRAARDGDTWVVNGAKIWTTGAHYSDYGLCLARTDWDVPKHQGLTMFALSLSAPGVTIQPIRQLDGNAEFCQEFFDDVILPASSVVGELNGGWTVATRLLVHERNAFGGAGLEGGIDSGRPKVDGLFGRAAARSVLDEGAVRQLLGEAHALLRIEEQLARRVGVAMQHGAMPPAAGSVLKLFSATARYRRTEIGVSVAGEDAVAWSAEDRPGAGRLGNAWLMVRGDSIASGTNEIQRNIIGERVLGLPREPQVDRDVAFREVLRNPSPR